MVLLDDEKLRNGVIGGMLITFGVVFKNTIEQLKLPPTHPLSILGMIFFIGGWAFEAYTLSMGRSTTNSKLMVIVPSVLIVAAVMAMKKLKGKIPANMFMIFPVIFALSWLALGYNVEPNNFMGVIPAALVLISMMVALPWQRKSNVIDGPGMPLFVIAWFMIAYLNAKS